MPSATFQCRDRRFAHITASDQHWAPLCKVLGLEAWGAEPALQANAERVRRRDRHEQADDDGDRVDGGELAVGRVAAKRCAEVVGGAMLRGGDGVAVEGGAVGGGVDAIALEVA